MSIFHKSETSVSAILFGKLRVKPEEAWLVLKAVGKLRTKPEIWASMVAPVPKTKVLADTRRDLTVCITA